MMIRAVVLTAAFAALAACSPASDDRPTAPPVDASPSESAPTPAPEPTTRPAPLRLQAMTFDEFSQVVPPGLGCAFEGGDAVLLVASGPDDPTARAQAVLKIDDELVPLTGREVGGFDSLVDGDVFEGSGVIATVTTSGEGRETGIETTAWPGQITVRRGEAEVILPGSWGCGA